MTMNRIELLNQLLQLTVWMPIDGYDNYEISICAQVRNVKTKRILKLRIGNNGYYSTELWKNNKGKRINIHRLIAMTFIPNIENKNCVDHIDNNRLNNTISNLRWCNLSENQHNSIIRSDNTSGVKGICLHKQSNKWHAQIRLNNKNIHIVLFENLDDAKIARQKKAAELLGEFLNVCEK